MLHKTTQFALLGALALGSLAACGTTVPAPTASQRNDAQAQLGAQGLTTRYVDPVKGKDSNDGLSPAHAYKTLARGLKGSSAGDTLKLLPGVIGQLDFPTSGDTFPLQVPNGVTIQGSLSSTGAMQSNLSTKPGADGKADDLALTFAGDATIKDLEVDGFDTALKANHGTLSLNHLNFIGPSKGLDLSGTAQATLTTPYFYMANNIGVSAGEQAQVTVDGGQFDFQGNCRMAYEGIRASGNATIHVKNTQFERFPDEAINIYDSASGDVSDSTFTPTGQPCDLGLRGIIGVNHDAHLTLSRLKAQGSKGLSDNFVYARDSAVLTADQLLVTNHKVALRVGDLSIATVTNSVFGGNDYAIQSFSGAARLSVSGSTLLDNRYGISASILKLRNSRVSGGQIGVAAGSEYVDLGSSTSGLGKNTFQGSSETGVSFSTNDNGPQIQLQAVGNTWNPNTQGADAFGKYSLSEVHSNTALNTGKNFRISRTPGGFPTSIRLN